MFAEFEEHIFIGGVRVPIDTDFRIMCEFSSASSAKDEQRLSLAAERFYYAGLPDGVSPKSAAEGMEQFFFDGLAPDREKNRENSSTMNTPRPCFDFGEDEAYFVAAYMGNYHINLHTAKLHWFYFCELFRGLPDECKIKQIMGIRAVNLSEIPTGSEKKRIKRLKGIFALKSQRVQRFETAADRDRTMIEELKRRHKEIRNLKGSENC